MADGDMPKKKALARDVNRIGDSFIFPPRVIDDIHIKAELGRYRMRGMSRSEERRVGKESRFRRSP